MTLSTRCNKQKFCASLLSSRVVGQPSTTQPHCDAIEVGFEGIWFKAQLACVSICNILPVTLWHHREAMHELLITYDGIFL